MQITALVGSQCDDTHTAFRTEPPLTQEVLDCAVTNFFPAGLGDMLSTEEGLLIVARVGIPSGTVQDYARYLTASITYLSNQQRDAIGLIVFDDDIRNYVPPSTRQGQFARKQIVIRCECGKFLCPQPPDHLVFAGVTVTVWTMPFRSAPVWIFIPK